MNRVPVTTSPEKPAPGRRSLRLSPEGRYWLLAVTALMVVGLFKGINLVLLLACLLLAVWCLNALLAGRGLQWLEGQRTFAGPIFARTLFRVQLRVVNRRSSPVLGVRIIDRNPNDRIRWFVARIAGGELHAHSDEVMLPWRGRYSWGPLRASSSYPFGLVRRGIELAPQEELIVLPALGQLHRGRLRQYLTPVGFYGENLRGSSFKHLNAQAEFHGLRGFRSGDSPRWIHWRTSARCGELMVREFEDIPNDHLILIVDPERPRQQGHQAVDSLVSLAATICWEWCRQKGDRLILIIAGPSPSVLEGITSPEHAQRLLESLAVLTGDETSSLEALVDCLEGKPLPRAPMLLLCAHPSALGDQLSQRLGRPIASLDVDVIPEVDFYEPPALQTLQS